MLQTEIALYDNMSGPLYTIMAAANNAASALQTMQNVINADVSPPDYGDISEVTVGGSAGGSWNGAGRQIEEIHNRLNAVAQTQESIINAGRNQNILPEETEQDIMEINEEMERLQAAAGFLQENPFQMDLSVMEMQMRSITEALDAIEARQQEIGGSVGDVVSSTVSGDMEIEQPEPVRVPVEWQCDPLDVFTNSGAERFQQEVQSANYMLESLNRTQIQIQQTAEGIDILPEDALADFSRMQQRIQNLTGMMQRMADTPIGADLDDANSMMERLRLLLAQAGQEQDALNAAIRDMDVEAANSAYLRLSQIINNTEQHIRDNTNDQGQFNRAVIQGTENADRMRNMIARAAGAFAGILSIRSIFGFMNDSMELFDTQLNAEVQTISVLANMLEDDMIIRTQVQADTEDAVNSINAISESVDGNVVITAELQMQTVQAEFASIADKAAEIQKKGMYGDEAMLAGAGELATYFKDIHAVEMMMDTLSNYAMGMSNGKAVGAEEMVNYATNLGKVMCGAYDSMSKKGFEFTDAQKAIIEGTATQQEIAGQLGEEYVSLSGDMQAAAAITQVIDQNWANLYATMSNTPRGRITQMTNAFGDMKEMIGEKLYPYILLLVDTINENQETIEKVLDAFAEGLSRIIWLMDVLLEGTMTTASFVEDNWSVIEPIVYGMAGAMAAYAAATTIATAAQWAYNAAQAASPVTWIIVGIGLLIGLVIMAADYIADMGGTAQTAFGVICGAINVSNQLFYNLCWAAEDVCLGINNAVTALGMNTRAVFHNALSYAQQEWYSFLSSSLTVIETLCEAMNTLPFISFDHLGDAADKYAQKAAEASENSMEYTSVSDAFQKGMSTYDAFRKGWAEDAYAAGAAWGDDISNRIADMFSLDMSGYGLDEALKNIMNNDGILDKIGDDTGAIKDSMDITEEDLKYLRDIAEQETVNRFTTAEITIEQTNHNMIQGGMDFDGVMAGLTDAVYNAVDIITEGVHE